MKQILNYFAELNQETLRDAIEMCSNMQGFRALVLSKSLTDDDCLAYSEMARLPKFERVDFYSDSDDNDDYDRAVVWFKNGSTIEIRDMRNTFDGVTYHCFLYRDIPAETALTLWDNFIAEYEPDTEADSSVPCNRSEADASREEETLDEFLSTFTVRE